jgi:hypothetical protein
VKQRSQLFGEPLQKLVQIIKEEIGHELLENTLLFIRALKLYCRSPLQNSSADLYPVPQNAPHVNAGMNILD